MQETKYYTIAVALDAIWKQAIYIYSSDVLLESGEIVLVPFGAAIKPGYVLEETDKPEFKTKSIKQSLGLQLPDTSQKLYRWLQEFYPGSPGIQLQYLLPSLLKTRLPEVKIDALAIKGSDDELTSDQQRALTTIQADEAPVVLQGITGSGKTRLYCELAKEHVENGKDVLILYPEISLTSQLFSAVSGYYGKKNVHVYHSKQSSVAQRKTWLQAIAQNPDHGRVFVGPRSALFLPIRTIGLIIVDEAHDGAYKQDTGSRYNGLLVAAALAKIHTAKMVFGSATPPIQETQQIVNKGGVLVQMKNLAKPNSGSRLFDIIDMTNKNNRSKQSHLLSKILINSIGTTIKNGEQALVFLNRRGTARMLLCDNCGWHAECSNCDMPLVYHHDNYKTKCHICGQQSSASPNCPECKNSLTQRSPGTKAIEQELIELFPNAKIARYDSDNNKVDSFAEQYDSVRSGEVDILIGTQLLTKGLDLPLLSTVGILQADSALLMPDYTSEERAFQQLVQVSGRVGRGHVDTARVILQTYQPEHKLFSFVQQHDWNRFYKYELSQRRSGNYPPYSYAMRIWATKPSAEAARKACAAFAASLEDVKGVHILGPAPSFYEKRANKYSWQIILRSSSRKQLSQIATALPKDLFYDLDPISLL